MSIATAVQRVFNFSPGPAMLPLPVLEQIRDEMLSLHGSGSSILEISHRDDLFLSILADAKQRLAQLLGIPDNYRILFLQGGSRLQFAMIPMNLAGPDRPGQYLVSGTWGKMACDEAQRIAQGASVWDGKSTNYSRLPSANEWTLPDSAGYLHITSNETIQGVQFQVEPACGSVPLVCDSSSDILSRPVPITKYGMIYACAQKNAGPAGVTIVILRDDLLERSRGELPGYMNFKNHADEDSLYNTPPTFGIYVIGLVARWLQQEVGGLAAMQSINERKARMLYDVIDASDGFYQGHATTDCRSAMNVTFRLAQEDRQAEFLREAERQELVALKGHRSVGGIRASIYNAMPIEGVERLREHMIAFQKR